MSDTPMIALLLSDISYQNVGAPKLRVMQWEGDHSTAATLDLTALAKEVGDMRTALTEARAERDAYKRDNVSLEEIARCESQHAIGLTREADTLRTQLAAARVLMSRAAEELKDRIDSEYNGPLDVSPNLQHPYMEEMRLVHELQVATATLSEAP